MIVGRLLPIHISEHLVGEKRLFYEETSRFIQCDIAYDEVVVYMDDTHEYVYPLKSTGNGSCMSDYYVWEGFETYRLSEAIDKDIVSLNDFLESALVVPRPFSGDE